MPVAGLLPVNGARLPTWTQRSKAARRAGIYQARLQRQGLTLHTPDAIVAGTARAHGAVLITDNLSDFPMSDIVVEGLPSE